MRQLCNILSSRLLAAILAGLLLCMPAFASGNSWDKNSAFEVQMTNGGQEGLSAEEWFYKGVALADLGKYDEALLAYDQAISINLQHADAWYNKGVALGNLGKYDEALDRMSTRLTYSHS